MHVKLRYITRVHCSISEEILEMSLSLSLIILYTNCTIHNKRENKWIIKINK